jgi:hypothetical protein
MTVRAPVQKPWNYCNILRGDGLSYAGYVEQLTANFQQAIRLGKLFSKSISLASPVYESSI